MTERRSKHHFKAQDDIDLLKLVLSDPPFKGKHGEVNQKWETLLGKLKWDVTARTLSDRFALLVKQFKTSNSENLKKSGTEEEYTERDVLLQDIVDLMKESETIPDSSKTGREIRENSLKHLNQNETVFFQSSKKKKDADILEIFRMEQERKAETSLKKFETEKKTLELEEKRLLLEEKRLETEKENMEYERKQREEEQKQSFEERKLMFELMKQVLNKLS